MPKAAGLVLVDVRHTRYTVAWTGKRKQRNIILLLKPAIICHQAGDDVCMERTIPEFCACAYQPVMTSGDNTVINKKTFSCLDNTVTNK